MTKAKPAAATRPHDPVQMARFENAALDGNASVLREMLEAGFRADHPAGVVALHTAVRQADAALVDLLLRAGADVNAPNKAGYPAAYWAAERGAPEVMEILLAAGAHPDGNPKMGALGTPIWSAVSRGNPKVTDLLIRAGASLQGTTKYGTNLLHRAAHYGHYEVVQRLLETNLPIDARDHIGESVMHYAGTTSRRVIELLARHGAVVDGRDETGFTPALKAAHGRQLEAFEAFVKLGADPLTRTNEGRNAFDLALHSTVRGPGEEVPVQLLRLYPALAPTGATLDERFVDAVRLGNIPVVEALAALGADLGQKPGGRSLVQCAPKEAKDLKRLLRALKSHAQIASAMDDGSAAPEMVSVDDLPAETKEDIVLALQREVAHLRDKDERDVRDNLFNLVDPPVVERRHVSPKDIEHGERRTSALAVKNYSKMDPTGAPPLLVDGAKLIEGGHRHKAALKRRDSSVCVVEIGALLRMNWESWLAGETDATHPVQSRVANATVRHGGPVL